MKRRWISAVAVVGLLASSAVPAVAAAKAGSIDELRSTDADIVKAVTDLNNQVAAQQNEVAAAQQAFAAAQQAVAATEAHLAVTQQKIDTLQAVVRRQAIERYMQPTDDQVSRLLSSNGFDEATRRDELLREITNVNDDSIDQMKAARIDLDKERKTAADTQKLAEQRKNDAQKKLGELTAARDEKAKAEKVLQDRIAAANEEDDASGYTGGGRASRGNDVVDDGRVSAQGLKWPIHGSHPVTSPFGYRWGRLHAGLDIGIPIGTPVFAAKEGTVTFARSESGYGNYICIQSDGGFMTCYGHLSRFEVTVGQSVTQDTEIAESGNTGHSTGAHLHFETCLSGGQPACDYAKNYKDPAGFLP